MDTQQLRCSPGEAESWGTLEIKLLPWYKTQWFYGALGILSVFLASRTGSLIMSMSSTKFVRSINSTGA